MQIFGEIDSLVTILTCVDQNDLRVLVENHHHVQAYLTYKYQAEAKDFPTKLSVLAIIAVPTIQDSVSCAYEHPCRVGKVVQSDAKFHRERKRFVSFNYAGGHNESDRCLDHQDPTCEWHQQFQALQEIYLPEGCLGSKALQLKEFYDDVEHGKQGAYNPGVSDLFTCESAVVSVLLETHVSECSIDECDHHHDLIIAHLLYSEPQATHFNVVTKTSSQLVRRVVVALNVANFRLVLRVAVSECFFGVTPA